MGTTTSQERSNEDYIDAARERGATTEEIADDVGTDYQTALNRLKALSDAGFIDKRKIGVSYLWYPADA